MAECANRKHLRLARSHYALELMRRQTNTEDRNTVSNASSSQICKVVQKEPRCKVMHFRLERPKRPVFGVCT